MSTATKFISAYAAAHPDQPINIWGHSWGANSSLHIARKLGVLGVNVDRLITLDGVGRDNVTRPSNVASWLNVDASPSDPNFTDTVASLGNDWGGDRGADFLADGHITVDTNHGEVFDMVSALEERYQACF